MASSAKPDPSYESARQAEHTLDQLHGVLVIYLDTKGAHRGP